MEVQVNMVGVLAATIASMVLGGVWYAQPVFGKLWADLLGIKVDKNNRKGLGAALAQAFVAALLTAYVLAHVSYLSNQFFHNSFMHDALTTAFWLGLGISSTTVITHNAFEMKRKKLTLLTVAHQMVGFLLMGWVIGVIGL